MNITNAEFIECDWHNCDGEKYKGKYDLVFAHTTPAIADYDTFMKMMEASRKYCFYSKHTGFTDEIYDDLCSMVGIEKKKELIQHHIYLQLYGNMDINQKLIMKM